MRVNQKYCSKKCYHKAGYEKHHAKIVKVKSEPRKCVICGKEFTPKMSASKCCSAECKRKKKALEERARRKEKLESTPKICQKCGKPFIAKTGQERYCSDECRGRVAADCTKNYRIKKRGYEVLKKVCPNCGAEFEPKNNSQIYCSPKCRQVAEFKRNYKPAKNAIRQCENCGREFQPVQKNQKYCSKKCNYEADLKRKRQLTAEKLTPRKCVICGKEFTPKMSASKCCSAECKHERNLNFTRDYKRRIRGAKKLIQVAKVPKVKKVLKRTCANCGQEFEPTANNQKYCSFECAKERNNLRVRELRAAQKSEPVIKVKFCAICGAIFETTDGRKKYCSDRCRKLKKAADNAKRPSRRVEEVAKVSKALRKCNCAECGKEFETNNAKKVYCSEECYKAAQIRRIRKNNDKMKAAREKENERLKKIWAEIDFSKSYLTDEELAKLNVTVLPGCGDGSPPKEIPKGLKRCEYCGRLFVPKAGNQAFCTKDCQKKYNSEQLQNKKSLQKQRTDAQKNIEDMTRLASAVGLSYGKYKVAIAQGKTHAQLMAEYEQRRAERNSNFQWWLS